MQNTTVSQLAIPFNTDGQPTVDMLELIAQVEHYTRERNAAALRHEKLTEVMSRKSSRLWPPAKTAKFARRLMEAKRLVKNYEDALRSIESRLNDRSRTVTG